MINLVPIAHCAFIHLFNFICIYGFYIYIYLLLSKLLIIVHMKNNFNQLEYRCVSLPVLGYVIFSDTRKAVQPLISLTSQDMVPSEAMLDNLPVIL